VRRPILFAAFLVAFSGPARADEPSEPPAPEVKPVPSGYAFNNPRLLTQQLLWGLVHGVRLLANACRDRPDGAAAGLAYADWLDREHQRIADAAGDLARHYYGRDAVPLDALTYALRLKMALEVPLEEEAVACASFPEALATERYDLDLFFTLRRDAARLMRAEAVRTAVTRCRPKLPAEKLPLLETAVAQWETANGATETLARARFTGSVAETPEALRWRQEAGGGAVPAAVPCDGLAESLASPAFALDGVFGEESK
jgi:hypothetical protein